MALFVLMTRLAPRSTISTSAPRAPALRSIASAEAGT
jgi:hypothetical protein